MNKRHLIPSALIIGLLSLGIAFGARSKPAMTRIQVTPLVEKLEVNDSVIAWSAADLGAILSNTSAQRTPVPLLFSHQQHSHRDAAAGWLSNCSLESSGIWCDVIWTPFGRAEACTGAWRFISPAVRFHKDETTGVIHPYAFTEVSLTNLPALDGMAPVEIPGCPVPFFSNLFASYPGVKALGK